METTELNILSHDPVGRDAFLLRLERPPWRWRAGQLAGLGGENPLDQRDYSIASGEEDESLDIVYRLIPHGVLTPFLVKRAPGESLRVGGPYGRFTLRDTGRPLLFCATGTGIAPCRSFVRTHPGLKLTLLHGVRVPEDLYFPDEWSGIDYRPHCSREPLDGTTSRITDTLRALDVDPETHVYLCGANEMIYEAEEILLAKGVPKTHLFQEPYYYRAYDDMG